jgi:hypothetical protein
VIAGGYKVLHTEKNSNEIKKEKKKETGFFVAEIREEEKHTFGLPKMKVKL